jgi:hypothetical protein
MLTIFGVALLLRVAYLALVLGNPASLYAPDSALYEDLAKAFLASGGFNRQASEGYVPETERVPGYILFLAGVRAITGDSPLWPLLGQGVLDALTCLVVGLLAAQFGRNLFLIAGLLTACNLNLIAHSAMVLPESLFLLLFAAHLFMMVRFIQRPSLSDAFLAGVCFALALLTRSVLLFWAPAVLATVALAAWYRRVGVKLLGQSVGACLVPLVLCVGPLLVRNADAYGHFGLTSQGGTHSLFWVVPLAREFSRGVPFSRSQEEMRERLDRHLRQHDLDDMPQNPFERSRYLMEVAQGALREMSVGELARAWGAGAMINLFAPSLSSVPPVSTMERLRFYETPGRTPLDKVVNFLRGAKHWPYVFLMVGAGALTVAFRLVQGVGGVHLFRHRPDMIGPLLYLSAVFVYILVVTGPVVGVKYRLPLEPLLILLTAAGLHHLFRRAR